MLNSKGERELAYVVSIDNITPMNADRLECAHIGGWHCVVGKGEFKVGDKAVYFEIDSQLPDEPPFSSMEFLKSKHFKIRSQKIRGEISQGLLVSFDSFGWSQDEHKEGDFLTKELNVTYAVPDDNKRKAGIGGSSKYDRMAARHKNLFKKFRFFRWLMKRDWGKELLFIFLGRSCDVRKWPDWVVKTDEERVQNMPWILNDKNPWVATEKIDGTSATYSMRRGKFGKYEFYVCSRNVVFTNPNDKCFYETNYYTEIAERYNIREVLKTILDGNPDWEWVTLQGEIYGNGIQKRHYSMEGIDFVAFNLIDSVHGRWNSYDASVYMKPFHINWVPILDVNYILPDTVEELLEKADGKSVIDGKPREGIVFRDLNGNKSFKAVSNEYLLKYH